ncbi:MAG: hypothetical protein AAFQ36_09490 [Pseudomonadota bacterium]
MTVLVYSGPLEAVTIRGVTFIQGEPTHVDVSTQAGALLAKKMLAWPDVNEAVVDEVDVIRATLEGLGVKVDKRWGIERLREELAAAENPADPAE